MSRDKFNTSSLEVLTDQGRSVKNKFIQPRQASEKLALVYPGLRYSCDKPLLYYTTELLLGRGSDILQLWANYGIPEFQGLSQAEQTIRLIEDGKALLQSGLQTKTYSNLVMIGKSLGTLTMAFILSEGSNLPDLKTIWLTPLIHLPPVSQIVLDLSGPIFVAGSETDATFDPKIVSQIQSRPNTITEVVAGADHSLEIPGKPLRSIQVLTQLMGSLAGFLT